MAVFALMETPWNLNKMITIFEILNGLSQTSAVILHDDYKWIQQQCHEYAKQSEIAFSRATMSEYRFEETGSKLCILKPSYEGLCGRTFDFYFVTLRVLEEYSDIIRPCIRSSENKRIILIK